MSEKGASVQPWPLLIEHRRPAAHRVLPQTQFAPELVLCVFTLWHVSESIYKGGSLKNPGPGNTIK